MLKIIHNDILRNDEKIGYLDGNQVWSHEGKKLGFFEDGHVYDYDAKKIAYLEGEFLYGEDGSRKARLEEVTESIEGVLPDLAKCAIYVLLGN
jgi:hypothetical protein